MELPFYEAKKEEILKGGLEMKRQVRIIITGFLFLATMGYTLFVGPDPASACRMRNWGSPGGGDYVPKWRPPTGSFDGPSLTKEQAFDIVANHIKKFNPNLQVGQIKDAGPFYEVEILSDGREVVERLGVDKQSGSLQPLY
jgi:hypothetical protein